MSTRGATWALDLDGVVWLAGHGIPGSAEAVARLRGAGDRVIFLTNNSGPTVAQHCAALAGVGIQCGPQDLLTSAQAAASVIAPGDRVAVVGDEGVREALSAKSACLVDVYEPTDVVVVGRSVELDYRALSAACSAVRHGARFIATNTDTTFPVRPAGTMDDGAAPATYQWAPPDGLLPGAGALVAFIAAAAGREPEVAGKPHEAMAALVRSRAGRVDIVAGDRPNTDGLFAQHIGAEFALVLSGVTRASDLPVEPSPGMVAEDLLGLVEQYQAQGVPAGRQRGEGARPEGSM